MLQIIDFERKGNVVRFYLGEKTPEWGWTNPNYKYDGGKGLETPDWLNPSDTYYGDDWDDRPYECNAGQVYGEFIKGYKDISFSFDDIVLEPCNGEFNSQWSKNDMAARRVPCIIVVPKDVQENLGISFDWQIDSFQYALGIDGIKRFYFGDTLENLITKEFL